jgi:hypothetical protein
MFSYSHFETFALFLGALAIVYCTYEEVVKRLAKEPEKPSIKPSLRPQNKASDIIAQPVANKPLYLRFEVEIKDSKVVHELTNENFKELLSPYFIAVDYLLELWIFHPFNLIITDRLPLHFGKYIKLEGFIRHNDIPDIYIKAKTSRHHRTGILLHEISHQMVCLVSKQKNVRIAPHGPLFKKHLKLLFAPLLKDRTYYRKHHELSYHLKYESNRHTPTRDMCV